MPTTTDYSVYRSREQTLSRNKVKITSSTYGFASRSCQESTLSESPVPVLRYLMDVNSLNYCNFSFRYPQNDSATGSLFTLKDQSNEALIALPKFVEPPKSSSRCDRKARKQQYHPFYRRARESGYWFYK
ncbi:uncharacterized protein ARMOST_08731 [Armillaria ostoyae]|uniref:Uncharacterized protein n=1 Tax=Armillaria ostoyae TaxID=47428 RepID=A0A284R9H8_ARMOS|nr:uncharacterized protein ARMOST_08731 [Armillaria ostoyae]